MRYSWRPQWSFRGGLDSGLDLGLVRWVRLRLDGGLRFWFSLLLLLHEDLVVQDLELSWVPVDQTDTKSKNQNYTW